MNIRLLQIFSKVCEEGTITKASEKLYMTQPAVSHAIHDLEAELQVKLFHRYGKRIYLNETGKLFLERVERLLLSYDELTQHIPFLEEESCIRIGSSITIANDQLPKVLQQFKKRYPHTEVQVHVESAANILHRLQQHEIDIALVEGLIQNAHCKKRLFSSYRLLVICSSKHPLAQKHAITWEEVKAQTWLLREQGSAARDTFDSACHLHQISIVPLWISVNSQALLQAVRADLGITILPDFIINSCPFRNELHVLSIEQEELRNDNHIVYDSGLYLSQPIIDFMQLLEN